MHAASAEDLAAIRPKLESLHLDYSWKMQPSLACNGVAPPSDLHNDLFSEDLTLPLQTLLDDVVVRFIKNSLVRCVVPSINFDLVYTTVTRRYPLIFGDLARVCSYSRFLHLVP